MLIAISESRRPRRNSVRYPVNAGLRNNCNLSEGKMPPKQQLKLPEEGSLAASAIPSGDAVPRLLYLADVPVESYMHGSSLVYRLFESYPAEKLLIVEGLYESQADRRLPNVQYRAIKSSLSRLLKNRYPKVEAELLRSS